MGEAGPAGINLRPFAEAIALRLADEGIPVRAIARSVKLPSDEVYELIEEAQLCGTLIEMPRNDWPIGSTRGSRAAFNGTPLENEDDLKFACARTFKATRLEASVLAVMLKRNQVTKQQLHQIIGSETDPKIVDVVICHLRKKLKHFDLAIETVWGIGYLISLPHRETAISLLIKSSIPAEAACG